MKNPPQQHLGEIQSTYEEINQKIKDNDFKLLKRPPKFPSHKNNHDKPLSEEEIKNLLAKGFEEEIPNKTIVNKKIEESKNSENVLRFVLNKSILEKLKSGSR